MRRANPFRLLGRLFKATTPAVGKRIRGVGLALLTGSAATGTAAVSLPEVPDSPDTWVELARTILQILTVIQAIVGMIMTGAGQGQAGEVISEDA